MRIAFFSPHCDPLAETGEPDAGGQCIYELKVAGALARQGHEVRVYTRRWGNKARYGRIANQAAVFRYPMGPANFLRKEDMGPYLPEFVGRVLADQTAWLAEADVLHGHYWDGGAAAFTASLALGRPLVFTSHSLGMLKRDQLPDTTPDGSLFRYDLRVATERRILRGTDAVVALSGNERSALTDRYGTAADKIHIVPGGVEAAAFEVSADKRTLQRELGYEADHMLFTAGRLDPRKGFLELINAIPTVAEGLQRAGRTVAFAIPAGPRDPSPDERDYLDTLRQRATDLGVMGLIHWFHRLSDEEMRRHYSAADLFLCPSPYEPFGLVLVEAFASGTPVVATCHGGPTDIVTQGVDGYLADPTDPEAFAGRILDVLLASEEERRHMSAAALCTARERYSWSSVAAAIADVYATVR